MLGFTISPDLQWLFYTMYERIVHVNDNVSNASSSCEVRLGKLKILYTLSLRTFHNHLGKCFTG